MMLFNALLFAGHNKNIVFSVPFLNDLVLFKININSLDINIFDFITIDIYNKNKIFFDKKNQRVKNEIPDYEHIKHTLFQSGILKPDGLKHLENIIDNISSQNITQGGDIFCIALDTNLLRDRFFSTFLLNFTSIKNLDFVLCETVRDELKNRKDKISKNLLKDFGSYLFYELEKTFLNQNCLEDRLRYIGFIEYIKMRKNTCCEEIETQSTKSGTKNDQIILEAYSNYVDIGKKIIFISRDNEAVRMMAGEDNVIPVLLEHSYSYQNSFNVNWNNFFELLYLLAVIFGKINLIINQKNTASIKGVWKGKDVHEWENNLSLIEIIDSKNDQIIQNNCKMIVDYLDKNISILQKL